MLRTHSDPLRGAQVSSSSGVTGMCWGGIISRWRYPFWKSRSDERCALYSRPPPIQVEIRKVPAKVTLLLVLETNGILHGALADEYEMTKSVLHAPNTSPRACVGMAVSSDDFRRYI